MTTIMAVVMGFLLLLFLVALYSMIQALRFMWSLKDMEPEENDANDGAIDTNLAALAASNCSVVACMGG